MGSHYDLRPLLLIIIIHTVNMSTGERLIIMAGTEWTEWNQTHGTDVFDTIPLIPLQPLPRAPFSLSKVPPASCCWNVDVFISTWPICQNVLYTGKDMHLKKKTTTKKKKQDVLYEEGCWFESQSGPGETSVYVPLSKALTPNCSCKCLWIWASTCKNEDECQRSWQVPHYSRQWLVETQNHIATSKLLVGMLDLARQHSTVNNWGVFFLDRHSIPNWHPIPYVSALLFNQGPYVCG